MSFTSVMAAVMTSRWGNVTGAFADVAVLLPLLAALVLHGAVAPGPALATTGLAYLASAWIFRVPMAVQPFKAMAAGAIAVGASFSELRVAGAILGLVLLIVLALRLDRFSDRVPFHLVHSVQLALGLLLAAQGFTQVWGGAAWLPAVPERLIAIVLLAVAVVVGSERLRLPLLGLLATAAIVWSVLAPAPSIPVMAAPEGLRVAVVLGLVLPQLPLTLTNSVVSTQDVSRRYFGERASRVTARALLHSIGWGNLAVAAVGGLPFCHGAGGLTAHVRGGSTHWASNVVIGGFLVVLAGVQFTTGGGILAPPPWLLAALLVAVGVFHVLLARPTWARSEHRPQLLAVAVVALATRDLLWATAAGVAVWAVLRAWRARCAAQALR